jgi:hypothetical protein
VRETYRRSGGRTPRLGQADVMALYEAQLADVNSVADFRHARLNIDADAIVPREVRERYAALPSTVSVRGRDVDVQYDVEEGENGPFGVARLRLPEKLARTLVEEELPSMDRPLRFVVPRGARGAARGDTLEALQEELDRPFTSEEIDRLERAREDEQRERRARKQRRFKPPGDRGKRGRHRRR